jgi:TonB family protein
MFAAAFASARAMTSGSRVRVLGVTMARQVATRVDPVYPASALEQGVTGEVVLYAAVSKDGTVEQVAVVDGPKALQSAAMDAVKQWRFKPWMVDGAPAEVDTTVVVNFKATSAGSPGGTRTVLSGSGLAKPRAPGSYSSVGIVGAGKQPLPARVDATNRPPSASVSASAVPKYKGTGGINWEVDRRAALMPSMAVPTPTSAAAVRKAPAPSTSSPVLAQNELPALSAARPFTRELPGSSASGRAEGAIMTSSMATPPKQPTGTVLGSRGRSTEWQLLKKMAPEYPADAEEQGIEGVVLVSGVVKTDGTLRDLRAVSGPAPLRQAAIDAAAQYVYEPVVHGDELNEARTQVPVTFTLSGPAKVAPEVMAGRILNSYTPSYPAGAVEAGVSGEVMLHVVIGRQGQVRKVQVVSGQEMLRATAVNAVKQWQYLPYKRNGVDVDVETDVIVRFSIVNR